MGKAAAFAIVLSTLSLCSCGSGQDTSLPGALPMAGVYMRITAEEASQMMELSSGYILLDVRTQSEYDEKRIPGAVLIPDYELAKRVEAELPDKEAQILIYCRSGRRSASAAKELISMGYTSVYDFGGIIDWPYETESGR